VTYSSLTNDVTGSNDTTDKSLQTRMAFSFGGGAASTGSSFAFGAAPASAPATTAATGFAFGSNPPASAAKPVASLSTGLSFGSTGATGFGAAAPAFGAAAATTSAAAPAFGAAAAPTTSLFGATATAPAPAAFGTPATAAPSLFGAPAAAGTSSLFGTASTAASGFGTATSTTTGFGLTAAPKPTGFATPFGASVASTATPSFGLGATTTTTPAFGLGAAPTATAAAAPAFGFGATAATAAPAFGLGASTTTTAAPALGLGGGPAQPAVGLGGQSTLGATAPFGVPSSSFQALSGAGTTQAGVAVAGGATGLGAVNKKDDSWKDQPVPPEFNQDVEAFRKFVKDQKGVSTDMSHLSLPKLHQKIRSDVEGLTAVVQQLGSGVAKQKAQLERLKKDCAKELVNVEVAQRTKDTPPALQYENNNGPIEYFNRLLANFESQMVVYKRQIEDVENYLQTAAGGGGGPQSASAPETLIKAMQKTHLAFVSLAGRYQPLHEAIQQQKSIYVQQYRQKHGTTDNPFFDRTAGVGVGRPGDAMTSSRVGPSPFTGKPDPVSMARAAALAHQSATTNQTGTAGPPTFGTMSSGNPAGSFGAFSGGAGNTTGFGQSNNTSLFGASTAKPAFGAPAGGSLFGNTTQQQPGLLGSMLQTPAANNTSMGLFGQQTPQNQLTFGGKRGKH